MARKLLTAVVVGVVAVLVLVLLSAALSQKGEVSIPPREQTIPASAVKMTPLTDLSPPILRSGDWETPVPMPGPVNTAGAEDSPFITSDGKWFFFFFTPDLHIPVQNQLGDKVTGIWWMQLVNGTWTEPKRIVLGTTNSLDGDEFVQNTTMWFGSVRVGNLGEIDIYTAEHSRGKWTDVENAGQQLNVQYDIGAFCFTQDGNTMYYGKGGDLWKSSKSSGSWATPSKVPNLDGVSSKDQPFVTPDGLQLWFTGQSTLGQPGPALFRCTLNGTVWSAPVEIVSRFAGEPNMDAQGNLYFVHHYVAQNGSLIEADIYVAHRKNVTVMVTSSGSGAASSVLPQLFEVSIPAGMVYFIALARLCRLSVPSKPAQSTLLDPDHRSHSILCSPSHRSSERQPSPK